MKPSPFVSIVLPFYNGQHFLEETLRSFIEQTYHNWECLVIDDYSPSSGKKICASFNDSRIRYIKNDQGKGMANARNTGCQLANGEFIALNDQDDISLPNRLLHQIRAFQRGPELLLIGTWRKNFGLNNHKACHEIDPERIKIRLLGNSQFTNPSVMFRACLFKDQEMKFDQKMAPADDYDFICRVSILGSVANIPEILCKYRIHDKQASTEQSLLLEKNALLIKKKYINHLLNSWIKLGLEPALMAEIFSKIYPDNLTSKEIEHLFQYWSKINVTRPLLNQNKWNGFLGERFLMTLSDLNFNKITKIKSIFNLRKIIWAFLLSQNFYLSTKTIIKSILK